MLFKNLDKWAQQNNIAPKPQSSESKQGRVIKKNQPPSDLQQSPPMMYRAQVAGRCNLQFAGDKHNLTRWEKEWKLSQNNQPSYQYHHEPLDSDHPNYLIHSIKLTFPYRVLSNSGQDSILRPVLTAHGIPYIPGSSIKGIFKRSIKSKPEDSPDIALISQYCGTEETPGILRFHGAYPIGDWSQKMVDIVHPQQSRQVKDNKPTSAYTLISFYQPEFVFEFSSINIEIDWQTVERILREALSTGLGGKTSTGYGFLDKPDYANPDNSEKYQNALHVSFKGEGVSSTLLNSKPEFRPNMFKAALRGHMMRLLGGVCSSEDAVNRSVDLLLGNTDNEGIIKIFWESTKEQYSEQTTPISYLTEGILHLTANSRVDLGDLNFIGNVLQFGYIMGGFGKSWRRVWHKDFMREYKRFSIGCHWQLKSEWINFTEPHNVNSEDSLKSFLKKLYQTCGDRLGSRPPAPINNWREAWHPDRVNVYSKVINNSRSQAIQLFHQEPFKYTPAIGGKTKEGQPTSVSSVWHRILPIGNGNYLEIVTIFRQPSTNWIYQQERNMRDRFINELTQRDFQLVWGT